MNCVDNVIWFYTVQSPGVYTLHEGILAENEPFDNYAEVVGYECSYIVKKKDIFETKQDLLKYIQREI